MDTTESNAADIKNIVKLSYDKIAPAYLEWSLSRPSPRLEYLDHIMHTLTPGSKVLELGCGQGASVTEALCQHEAVSEVIANDISDTQIRLAKERCAEWTSMVKFELTDMMYLTFGEAELDDVVVFFSIFHLPKAEQVQMIEKIHSWLKPGRLLVCNFAADSPKSPSSVEHNTKESTEFWSYFQTEMFWSGHGTEGTKRMVSDAGFELLVAGLRNANEDLDDTTDPHSSDPDRDVEFLWIVANKRTLVEQRTYERD